MRNQLVAWTSGNVSARNPESGLVVIKPSGIRYERLSPQNMVVVDLDGRVIEGGLKPSSDTSAHVYVYRNRPDVNGVVHTHSDFATAWAAVGRPIPAVLTAICDEFGGIFCKTRKGDCDINLPLIELEIPQNSPNFQFIEDYWYWFWNWR